MFYYNSNLVISSMKYILICVVLTMILYQFFGISRYADTGFQWCPNNENKRTMNKNKEEVKCDCNKDTVDNTTINQPKIIDQINEWMFDSNLAQDDPDLIEYTKVKFLHPPSPKPYNLTSPWGDPAADEKQHIYAIKILKGMKNGFFIECGANNGEFLSSTLVLERDHGWTGLLIEGDPYVYPNLLDKNRKAWTSPACLSTVPHPQKVTFVHASGVVWGGLSNYQIPSKYKHPMVGNAKLVNVTCLPLFTLLSALDVKTVDYFALDIEGSELKVLKTIPFESILFKVLTIEHPWIPEGKDALVHFMQSKGYVVAKTIAEGKLNDVMFVHKSLKDNIHLAFGSSNKTAI